MEDNDRRRRYTAALRDRLLKQFGHACVVCGVTDDVVRLQLAHIVPISRGGTSSEENLTLLCPNCHLTLDRQPREHEYVSFLHELLEKHPHYSHIRQGVLLGDQTRYQADIIAERKNRSRKEIVLIECKSYAVLTEAHLRMAMSQLKAYKESFGDCRMVLSVSATLMEKDLALLRASGIEVWDLPYIADQFSTQIHNASPSHFKALLLTFIARSGKLSQERTLLRSLSVCSPGRPDWPVYQKLVGEILESLFTPPLGKPIPELSDRSQANRRDFIMPNYADEGFWSFLRNMYRADYIVIDAKNHAGKVKKHQVLQIANYLKPHGAGLFGIIVSRNGGDASGCEHTLREQWLVHRKLILVLNDQDVEAMLLAKFDGRKAEDVLGQKIEEFRLSM